MKTKNKIIAKSGDALKINVSLGNLMIHFGMTKRNSNNDNCLLPVYGLLNEFRIPITETILDTFSVSSNSSLAFHNSANRIDYTIN